MMAVVDDMDTTGYSATSGFSDGAYIGYNSFRHHAYGDSSGDKATWTFSGLAAGNYRVSTTWPAAGSNSPAAPFTIRSGGTVVGAATVDQRIAPNDAQISGTWWEDLGTGIYSISGGDLTIEVSDQTTGYVMADAVRVEPWSGPEMHVITGDSKVDDNSGTVNFGTAASWWNVEKSFTVRNAGVDSPLTLGTLSVPTGFTLVSGLGSQTLQPGETTSFTVRLDTSSPGAKSGQVSLVTNDGNENPFNFTVNGTVNNFQVIDDQDATGFTYSSGFGSGAYIGYNSYRHHANGDNTGDKATWTFNNIPAGTYRISGTWTSAPSNTAAAPFSVRSNGVVVGSALVDQRQAANDAQAQGAWWEDLGTGIYTVAGGTLSVEVSDQTTGSVIADAIRIEPWTGPEVHVIATGGIKVDDNSGVIDYGMAASWWNVDKTFTVSNAGVGSALTLGSLSIPAGFTLVSGLGTQTLQPGESTSFIVRLDTSATGTKNGQISLATNDGNENPFNFTVKGIVNNYQIVDDLDPSLFSLTSGFANGAYLGYNTYFHYAYGDGSGDKATWTFNDLPPGTYRVSGTWPAASYASAAAPFTIRAGGSTIGTSAQNQQVAPNDFQSAGVWWEDLGTASYSVGSSPLTVEARDQTSNMVMADAIRIELLNAAPAAGNDQISVHGWNATTVPAPGVLANDTDREGAALTLTTVTPPQHGTLTWQTGGGFIYTPARDGATSDSFQYRVSDGTSNSSVAAVELTFTGLNTAPVATTIANRTGDEDGTFDPIALRDFFADLEDSDDLLTYTATSPSSNLLELAIDDSTDNLLLNLVADAHGAAEVTVTATDTGGRSAATVFTVTVTSVNDAPSLANRLVTLDPAGLLTGQQVGQLAVTDLDAETHTFVLTSGNENGGLTIDETGRIFVADAEVFDFAAHGPYEYTLQVTDGAAAVTTAKLALAASDGFSVSGPATAGQNETYTVELNGGVSFAEWTIDWGDGVVSVVPGIAVSASHLYQSPTSPNISATISVGGSPVSTTAAQLIDVVQNRDINLVRNGSFETHAIPSTNTNQWSYFPSIPEWTGSNLELHRNLYGPAADGDQYMELDATASATIEQSIAAVAGSAYKLKFSFKGRPDNPIGNDDKLSVRVLGASSPDALLTPGNIGDATWLTVTAGADSWFHYEGVVFAQGSTITLHFEDLGISNSFGTFLDNVSFESIGTPPTQVAPLGPYQVDENTAIEAILLDSIFADLDAGDVLTYQVTDNSNPLLLTATIEDGLLLVDLASDQYGNGSVAVTATDLSGMSVTANIDFIIQCSPVVTLAGPESIAEGATASFVLTLAHPSNQLITVGYVTGNGTAVAGTHFPAATGTATFAPGETSATVPISTTDDALFTGDTYFVFGLTNFANAQASAMPLTLVTLVENDSYVAPTLTFVEVARISDGAEQNTVAAKFEFTREGNLTNPLDVYFELGGTAVAGADYVAVPNFITIPANQASYVLNFSIIDDGTVEDPESINVSLDADPAMPATYYLAGARLGYAIIADNDTLPLPTVDIDVDSDNDGALIRSELEETYEAISPGMVMFTSADQNSDGDVIYTDRTNIAEDTSLLYVALSVAAKGNDLTGYKLELSASSPAIRLWSSQGRAPIKPTLTVGTDPIPERVFVEGYSAGSSSIQWRLRSPGGTVVASDSVLISVIEGIDADAWRAPSPHLPDVSVPENNEHLIGIRRNGDDDNGDSVPDGESITMPLNDNDLQQIALKHLHVLPGVEYRLTINNPNVRVWDEDSRAFLLGRGKLSTVVTPGNVLIEWPAMTDGSTTLELSVWDSTFGRRIPDRNGSQWTSDSLQFTPFNSIIAFMGGRLQDPNTIDRATEGVFDMALQVRKEGFHDVYVYGPWNVSATGTGPAYDEISSAISSRGVKNVSLIAYSWGATNAYAISQRLEQSRRAGSGVEPILSPFSIVLTVSIDGVTATGFPERRRPRLTALHFNHYQPNPAEYTTNVNGVFVSGAVNILWPSLTHESIDDNADVQDLILAELPARLPRI